MTFFFCALLTYLSIIILTSCHMGGCITVCLLSCVNCCAKEIGTACAGLLGRDKVTKLFYIVLDLLIVVPAVFLFYYLQNWTTFVNFFSRWISCPQESGGQ
jgi:hypothetical protein